MRAKPNKTNQLRIIGGQWRGRKLAFPAVADLRPSADRVRETLFNWLQAHIPGARCLDLFAGSGALGLEALSRGAVEVVMVEQNARAAAQIRQHLQTLDCDSGQVVQTDAFQYLQSPATAFDVVFLDPPYRLDCLAQCCQLLEQGGWLKTKAFIYLEDLSQRPAPALPDHWELLRSKKAGEVGYYLACRSAASQPSS
jgi:16S rRNA (guanine966-N2)-methyltransferase